MRRGESLEDDVEDRKRSRTNETGLSADASHGENEEADCSNQLSLDLLKLTLQRSGSSIFRAVELSALAEQGDREADGLQSKTPEPEEDGKAAVVLQIVVALRKDAELGEESEVLGGIEAEGHDGFGGRDLANEGSGDAGEALEAGGLQQIDEAGQTGDGTVTVGELAEAEE